MPSCYDGVVTIVLMAAVGIVFGFLGGVVADTGAVAVPIATGAVFLLSRAAPLPARSSRLLAKPGS